MPTNKKKTYRRSRIQPWLAVVAALFFAVLVFVGLWWQQQRLAQQQLEVSQASGASVIDVAFDSIPSTLTVGSSTPLTLTLNTKSKQISAVQLVFLIKGIPPAGWSCSRAKWLV